MRIPARVVTIVLCFLLSGTLHASTYGSVEPFANTAVVDIRPLMEQPLPVREAFATRLLECGMVNAYRGRAQPHGRHQHDQPAQRACGGRSRRV